jgi:hypothetical protein
VRYRLYTAHRFTLKCPERLKLFCLVVAMTSKLICCAILLMGTVGLLSAQEDQNTRNNNSAGEFPQLGSNSAKPTRQR